jgi:hypothetical protein
MKQARSYCYDDYDTVYMVKYGDNTVKSSYWEWILGEIEKIRNEMKKIGSKRKFKYLEFWKEADEYQ